MSAPARRAAAAPVELELKLEAPPAFEESELVELVRELGFDVGPVAKRAQVDRYLDTAELDLARRGVGLRVRESDAGACLGLKLRGDGATRDGLWKRVEVELPVPSGAALPACAAALPEALRHRVEPVTLSRPLVEIARLATERSARDVIEPASGTRAELCVDRVRVGRDAGGARFAEVELEDRGLGSGALEGLSLALRDRLGLTPSRTDKLGRALALLRRTPPIETPPPFDSALPVRVAACLVFRKHLDALRRAEPDAREGVDVEGVHRMRVATRRLRASIRIFRDAFPAARLASLNAHMQRTGRALGPVRDLDVMLIALPELAGLIPKTLAAELEPLAALLEVFHARERARMLRFLEAPSRLRALERFDAFVARGVGVHPRGPGGRPLREVAPEMLESGAARVWKRGDKVRKKSPPEDLHALRIAIKRLRYTAETLAPLYGEALTSWLRRMTELQDVLGTYNDTGVAAAHLSGWIDTREGRRLPRRTLVAAGALLAIYERRGDDAHARFRKAWKHFAREKARRELGEIARSITA